MHTKPSPGRLLTLWVDVGLLLGKLLCAVTPTKTYLNIYFYCLHTTTPHHTTPHHTTPHHTTQRCLLADLVDLLSVDEEDGLKLCEELEGVGLLQEVGGGGEARQGGGGGGHHLHGRPHQGVLSQHLVEQR